nr:sodium-coupled monocarboxylate transporter 1-like [Lytechinus pictus]
MESNTIPKLFTPGDYAVCITMLVLSLVIGLVAAYVERRHRGRHRITSERFLLGSRRLNVIPVSMSMTIPFAAAINILGTPVDVYMYNTMFWWICLAYIIGGAIVCRMFVPLYFNIGVVSAFEYLELRFNKTVRVFCSLLFIVQMMVYLGIVLYVPSLVIQTVTGFNLWASHTIILVVALSFTTVGGMRAIVWSDVHQTIIILLGLIAAVVMGTNQVGGMGEVMRIARESDRFKLAVVSFDPTVRHTVWSVVVGMTVIVVGTMGTNQVIVQKYISLQSQTQAKMAVMLSSLLKVVVVSLCVLLGLVVYAAYSLCDPYTVGQISQIDQLTPFFVMDLFSSKPGLPGLFVSTILAASISSLSSGLTSLSAVTGEDVLKAFWPNISLNKYSWILRILTLLYGIVSLGFAALASSLQESILPLTISLFGVVGGIVLGIFTLGVFFHRSSSQGTMVGAVLGLIVVVWLKLGSTVSSSGSLGEVNNLVVGGCKYINTTTIADDVAATTATTVLLTTVAPQRRRFLAGLYRLSYQYYAPLGLVVTVALGMIASAVSGFGDPASVDPGLKLYVVDSLLCCLPVCLKDLVRRDGQHKEYQYPQSIDEKPNENDKETLDHEASELQSDIREEPTENSHQDYETTTWL